MSERRKADEAAAAWDARLRGARASSRDRAAFQAWLKQDAEHEAAHDRLQAALSLLRANARLPELSALRDEARGSIRASRRRRLTLAVSDRKSVVSGKSVSVRVELGGRRIIKNKKKIKENKKQ